MKYFINLRQKIAERGIKYALTIFDAKLGFGRFESLIFSNWFNPFATFWLNIRSFPLPQAVKFPVWVYGRPKLRCLSGSMKVIGRVNSGMIVFNKIRMMAPNLMTTQTEIVNQGTIEFLGSGEIGTGNKIVTYFGSLLRIGNCFKIQDQVNIGCMKNISIGNFTWVTHRCQIFDSNYHYLVNLEDNSVKNNTCPILIGNYCWIGNSTTISGGAQIPDFTTVASNSLVNRTTNSIPKFSIIGGTPARLLSTKIIRLYNIKEENRCRQFFKKYPNEVYHFEEEFNINNYL